MDLLFIPRAIFDVFFITHFRQLRKYYRAEIPSIALHSFCISTCQYPTTAEVKWLGLPLSM
jgi:hypothetical protein